MSITVSAALIFSASAAVGSAQAQACRGPDESSNNLRGYLVAMATATDSALIATRDSQAIPAALVSEVALVTDSAVCVAAGTAYANAERNDTLTGGRVPQPGDSALGSAVYVFLVKDRYVVVDAANIAGEFQIAWVFDSAFLTPLKRLGM